MLPLGNSSDSSFADLWKCILAHIKLSSWTSDRYISFLLKLIHMKIYLQWDMFMNLGSFWDSALHFKFAQIVFTTIFCIYFQWMNSLSWVLPSVSCEMLLCICLLCATTHLNNLEVYQVFASLTFTEHPWTSYPDTEMFAYCTSARFGDYLQRFRVFKFFDFFGRGNPL